MSDVTRTLVATTAQSVANHIDRQGWEDGDAAYSIGMVLADLMVMAKAYGVDFDAELATAREAVEDVYGDVAPVPGIVLPAPQPRQA